jgi:exoribonuclease R
LNASIQKFTKDATNALSKHENVIKQICEQHPEIEDRTNAFVFSIDPSNCSDFDDAFSIDDDKLTIYISNVSILLDELNLWESFSRRISTIYLPDKKRPMLPTILSDCLCSLQEGKTRLAFFMDVFLYDNTIKFGDCQINVAKNYCYEDPHLLASKHYKDLFLTSNKLSKKLSHSSHDVVANLMILMNNEIAKDFLKYKNGLFRSTIMSPTEIPVTHNIPEDVAQFVRFWHSSSGKYINLKDLKEGETISHELMNLDAYIHITSPIRRLVDLLNLIQFQKNNGLYRLSQKASLFYDEWIGELDYINTTSRSIKKVQNDCSLLDMCDKNPGIMEKMYDGYAFDRMKRSDGNFQYMVYLPEMKMVNRIVCRNEIALFEKNKYKMYLFQNEEKFKKKIRIQVSPSSFS